MPRFLMASYAAQLDRTGVARAPLLLAVSAAADAKGTPFVASTPAENRYGDVVAGPWKIDDFIRNPVMPFSHNYGIPPVAKAENVRLVDDTLMGTAVWYEGADYPLAVTVAAQYRQGFLRAFSVGFDPKTITARRLLPKDHVHYAEQGYLYTDNDLMEISAVPVPANPEALVAERAGIWRALHALGSCRAVDPDDLAGLAAVLGFDSRAVDALRADAPPSRLPADRETVRELLFDLLADEGVRGMLREELAGGAPDCLGELLEFARP